MEKTERLYGELVVDFANAENDDEAFFGYLRNVHRAFGYDFSDTSHSVLEELKKELHDFVSIIRISALRKDGTEALLTELLKLLPEGPRYYPEDIPTDATERFIAEEIVREKVFLLTGQEIPYSTAVMVDRFKEDAAGKRVTIYATIFIEKKSEIESNSCYFYKLV